MRCLYVACTVFLGLSKVFGAVLIVCSVLDPITPVQISQDYSFSYTIFTFIVSNVDRFIIHRNKSSTGIKDFKKPDNLYGR